MKELLQHYLPTSEPMLCVQHVDVQAKIFQTM